MATETFRLPDLGEGLAEGEVLAWLVEVGDVVEVNQPLVEVETAKAAVELPSPYAGRVTALHARAGETLDVGAPLITVEVAAAERGPEPEQQPAGDGEADGRHAVLVGYGPRPPSLRRRPRPRRRPGRGATAGAESPTASRATAVVDGHPAAEARPRALASPPVRKRARDLGIDLTAVRGSGPNGIVTSADLDAAVRAAGAPSAAPPPAGPGERRIPVTGVRKATAAAMVSSAFTAPHAAVSLAVDATESLDLAGRLAERRELRDVTVGPLLLVARAVLLAARRHPEVNARWDEQAQEIVVFDRVNLGIAAATPRGLLVPTITAADRLTLPELATALADLVAAARAGRTRPEALRGGTLTITNVGVFGVDGGTPILNPGEAVILCVGAVRPAPWVRDGQLAVRQVVQLSLSFDHRLIDGELASRFLADVGALLEDPALALAWC